jgi:carbon-monoxide dehydrogenase large subunit
MNVRRENSASDRRSAGSRISASPPAPGQYVGDIELPRQCYGVAVLSPHAHAMIKSIDVTRPRPRRASSACSPAPTPRPTSRRHSAVFHARILGRAEGICDHASGARWPTASAASAIMWLSSSPRPRRRRATPPSLSSWITSRCPLLVDLEQAAQAGAPKIWDDCPNGNIGVTIAFGDKAATDAAFASAKARRQGSPGQQPRHG